MLHGKRCFLGFPILLLLLAFDYPEADDSPETQPTLTNPLPHPPTSEAAPSWDAWLHPERQPRKVKTQSEGEWGSITSETTHADWHESLMWEDPLRKREWKTAENWRYDMMGPFFVFGNLGANSDEPSNAMKVVGKTGLACKVPLLGLAEVTVRGGPSVTYSDPLQTDRTTERSAWQLEMQARWPLLAGIGLEYDSIAVPALSPLDRNSVDQDVRFAFPVGSNSKLRLGAKHHWEGVGDPHSGADTTQLYLGLELVH